MLPTTTSDTDERLLQRSAAAVVMVAGELATDMVVEIEVADDGGAVKIWRGRGEIRRWRGGAGCGRRRREVAVCCGAAVSLSARRGATEARRLGAAGGSARRKLAGVGAAGLSLLMPQLVGNGSFDGDDG
ncbi:50S ribosomal protein L22 [Striga asiatica]|uniref:50S ribosomal protein L22 n=1 Tax=Striga asiatica TaxID=4170 RepID=A0A5A7Q8R1_STRAF|nr:50S ribosomal protein L22 [Striga asiatica]